MNTSGIYQITCWTNNKIYIGSAKDFEKRWVIHRSDLKLNRHGSITLQRAWNKHGKENFTFHILEYCDKENLIEREQFWLDKLKPFDPNIGYNILAIAGSRLGAKHSDETRAKLSIARRKRIIKDETRLKISKAHTNRVMTDIHRERLSNAAKGKPKSEAHKEGMRISRKNKREEFLSNFVVVNS